MSTLYQISEDVLTLNELLAEMGGDVSEPEIEAAFDAWFAEVKTNQTAKVDNYCALIREFEARAEARQNEAKRLQTLAQADASAAERLKKRLKWFMEATEQGKLETPRFKVAIQKNGGILPLILPDAWKQDPAFAPEEFHKKTITLDTEEVRSAIVELKTKAQAVVAQAQDESEATALYAAWLESDEEARRLSEITKGCAIGERGTYLRIR